MTTEAFAQWAIVELMGHCVRPGFASEVELAGGKMLRIDIPVSETDGVTEFYGSQAIYAIRPATEEIVRQNAYGRYGGDIRPVRPVDYRPQIEPPNDQPDFGDDDIPV